MFDIIGDIHGHADKLELLLQKLGYSVKKGIYSHPERKILFLGDYIDRGQQIVDTLKIVRKMVDSGNAVALMGNHEYNAILFNLPNKSKGYYREHSIKNIVQHYQTLIQFKGKQSDYDGYVNWFKTLPLFYETNNFRAVHAAWDEDHIQNLKRYLDNGRITRQLIHKYVHKDNKLNLALEETLKGKEIKIPDGLSFIDKDGHERNEIRIKWWENPRIATYKSLSVLNIDNLPEVPVQVSNKNYYKQNEKPVFFGHYWMKGKPDIIRANVCCLDYSVAKGGYLAAYRMDDDKELGRNKIVYV
jgi:hypothetical protein